MSEDKKENSLPDEVQPDSFGLPAETSGATELAEILEDVPPATRKQIVQAFQKIESHSGWLPSPDYLRRYEETLPGLAERIVAMPEREQLHRHKVTEEAFSADSSLKMRGQFLAITSLILLLLFAVFLAFEHQYEWAAKVAIFGIVGVVGIFVTGKWADVKIAQNESPAAGDASE